MSYEYNRHIVIFANIFVSMTCIFCGLKHKLLAEYSVPV